MSEISSYLSTIRFVGVQQYQSRIEAHPAFDILRQAVAAAAEDLKGTVTDRITDAIGRETRCTFAVTCPDFPCGVGVTVDSDTGAVKFHYDPAAGSSVAADAIARRIQQGYITIAVARALRQLGYRMTASEERSLSGERTVVLVGVA
jgi:hypothetical protein